MTEHDKPQAEDAAPVGPDGQKPLSDKALARAAREARRAQALRDNLRRRKDQARSRRSD